jgi:hypothetical protein
VLENGNASEIADAMKEPPICSFYLMYEREDKESEQSLWSLKEFNPMHSHACDLSLSFPKPWAEIQKE